MQRQREVRGVRGQERVAERERAEAGGTAASRPTAIQRGGCRSVRVSTQRVPATMYCAMKAIATTSPATKPPPGSLWPRRNR